MLKATGLLKAYVEFIIRRRLWVILAILATTVFLGTRIASLKVDMDPDIWAPQKHPYVQATKLLEQVFGGRNMAVIGIVAKHGDIYQPAILEKIQRIQAGIEVIPQAVRHNIISIAARKVKDIEGTRDGMQVRDLLDPLPRTPAELARLKAAIASNPIYINTLVSEDGKTAAVIADFKLDKDNPTYSGIFSAIRKLTDAERDDTVEIHLGGLPVDVAWFEFHMQKMPLFFGVALLIIMAIQYWSFRSLQGMMLPILTALLSVVWGLGLMGLLNVHMDGMNTTTPILIMAVAAGHAIQILKRYYEEYHRLKDLPAGGLSDTAISKAAVVESLVRVGPAMITAGLIATITFLSLSFASVSVVQHFGVFAGIGVLSALVLELTLIPAMRSWLRPPRALEVEREQRIGLLDRGLHQLSQSLTGGHAPWILGSVLVFVLLALAGITRLHTDNSLKRYNGIASEVRQDDIVLNNRLAGTSSIFFLIEGDGQDSIKDPKVLQGMATLQEFLARQPHVGKTQSLADLVKRMNKAMHADDDSYNVIPKARNLIAQYLFLYSLSGDPQDFDNFVDNDYQKAVIWVYLKDDSTAYTEELYRRAQTIITSSFPPGVRVRIGGSLPQTAAINKALTTEKYKNMLQMGLIVFLLASIALRSFVGGLFCVIPLATIVVANFGLMGWLGVPLDMGTAVTAAMAIGIGADYELYLLFRFREELNKHKSLRIATRESLLTSGKAILFVAFSVAGGYSVLLISDFAFYSRLAVMVIATMMVSSVSALLFLRSMMIIFKPKFVFGDQHETFFSESSVTEGVVK